MSANTKIEWADHTFNPWEGCQKVGPGCDHCYAEARNARFAGGATINWGPGAPRRRTSESNWQQPRKWNREAERLGIRYRVFCASLADVFDNAIDQMWRNDLFTLISDTPHLDWLLLTKRIGNVRAMLPVWYEDPQAWEFGQGIAHPNVWLGATIVSQEEADRDIPKLLAIPSAKRFLSMEPLLAPVDLTKLHNPGPLHQSGAFINALRGGTWGEVRSTGERLRITHGPIWPIDWVIVGGESGPNARPMHPDWARSLRDQCQAVGVPFLFKQWGEWLPWAHFGDADVDDPPEQTRFKTMEFVDSTWVYVGYPDTWATMDGEIDDMQCVGRVGKKAAGRLLDGRTWDEVPS